MTEFVSFGDSRLFEIAIRWTRDSEARARLPTEHGWSMGDLRITIGGQTVTKSRKGAAPQGHVSWYLSPLLGWLARNWAALLHEEAYPWAERSTAPAVVVCARAMERSIALEDDAGKARYREAQGWYRRHALRSASEGGLFPDLFIRRFGDDIELSWIGEAPAFAPEGFVFAGSGVSRLPVAVVATPLWELLAWAASTPPPGMSAEDRNRHSRLSRDIEAIERLTARDFDRAHAPWRVLEIASEGLVGAEHADLFAEDVSRQKPFVETFSPAVAMFGGVSPTLGARDVDRLRSILIETSGGADGIRLAALVADVSGALGLRPHEEGYELAEEVLRDLGEPGNSEFIDVRALCGSLEIDLLERALDTDSIRGVALAGDGFRPTILINPTSIFNANALGKRFTIAHELCHVLFDRSRARRVTHVSGPWAAPGVEKRANAFAAFLLMPRALLTRHFGGSALIGAERVIEAAGRLQVNENALVEHLYNMDMIDETSREWLRAAFRRH